MSLTNILLLIIASPIILMVSVWIIAIAAVITPFVLLSALVYAIGYAGYQFLLTCSGTEMMITTLVFAIIFSYFKFFLNVKGNAK